jgi:energy-coupling factor transporter ATP-binding protein EcfA2
MGTLADHIEIDALAARSVNLERDASGLDLVGYVPTARAIDTLARVLEGLEADSGTRAWSITGPYGCGKSSFALFLSGLLGPSDELRERAVKLLAGVAPELVNRVMALTEPTNGLIRAMTVAAIEPVATTISRALERGAHRRWGPKLPRAVQQAMRRVRDGADPGAVIAAVHAMASYAPVLVVVDEFGKNLEHHAVAAPGELFFMQELAELFSGTGGVRGGLLTLQHLAFEDYASSLSTSARREWAKVQGRFEDITFVDSPDQVVRLIADSIDHKPSTRAMALRLTKWTDAAVAGAERLGLTAYLGSADVIGKCFPVHPVAAAALPALCSKYGQYERTLVSFLASGEPDSVTAFCANNPDTEPLPTVGLAEVYDYFVTAARTLTGAAAGSAKWLEIEARINEALVDDEDLELLKIVGVLNLVSGNGALRASPDVVVFATDMTERRSPEIRRRLNQLCERGVLAFRSFADEYRLWNGTDFDVSGAIADARQLLSGASPAQLLTDSASLAPVIAGRHSQERGILRYFDVVFADPGTEIVDTPSTADGVLVYVAGGGPAPTVAGIDRPVVIVRSTHVDECLGAALELAAVRHVLRDRAADLANDWVARRELQERAARARIEVALRVARAFAPGRKGVRWLADGKPVTSRRGPSGVLSVVCDQVFSGSPTVRNEMVARRELTSQGAKARRVLMEAMLSSEAECRLGLDGYGPERAIYHAVLEGPGFHRARSNGEWRFGPPHRDSDWSPAWSLLQEQFTAAEAQMINVEALYDRLRCAPIGLKDGVIPILLTVALLYRRDDIAIYEEGTYQPRLTADLLERLVRNPDRFTIKNFAASSGDRRYVIECLAEALKVDVAVSDRRRNSTVLALMAPLLGTVRELPTFTLRTRTMSHSAIAVRDALLAARQPDEILFKDLPSAVALSDPDAVLAGDRAAIKEYASRLAAAVRELQQNWPNLLARIEEHLRVAMGTPGSTSLRADLAARAQHLVDRVLDPKLRSFLLTATESSLDDDDWLEAIALNAVDRPVRSWRDQDWPAFVAAATQLGGSLKRLEALNYEHIAQGSTEFAARRVTITNPDGTETSTILVSRKGDDQAVDELASGMVAEAKSRLPPHVHPALIARLIEDLLFEAPVAGEPPGAEEVRRHA